MKLKNSLKLHSPDKEFPMETAKSLITNLFAGNGHHKVCEVCGNEYDRYMEVRLNGETHIFDSFECAIHALAPKCTQCGCQIIGHGVEVNNVFYCCDHCARSGIRNVEDPVSIERMKT
jgi:hypothetical protein